MHFLKRDEDSVRNKFTAVLSFSGSPESSFPRSRVSRESLIFGGEGDRDRFRFINDRLVERGVMEEDLVEAEPDRLADWGC